MPDDYDDPQSDTPTPLPEGFRVAVAHALIDLGYSVATWESDGVNVRPPNASNGDEQYVGLTNLYRRAKAAGQAEWPEMIREFIRHVTSTLGGPKIPDDLNGVADQIRPRVGKPFARSAKAYPWGIPLPGTGLEINLVIDYPNTMAYVTDEMLTRTGRTGEELLEVALANLKESTPDDFFDQVSEELDIYVGHTGDGYDAARALLIEDLLPESPAGFWVAIPSREELAVWPVSFDALSKIHVIKMFARDNYREHAYPVSDEVFWVRNGTWHPFGISLDETNVTVSPPPEFLPVLERLGSRESGHDESEPPLN